MQGEEAGILLQARYKRGISSRSPNKKEHTKDSEKPQKAAARLGSMNNFHRRTAQTPSGKVHQCRASDCRTWQASMDHSKVIPPVLDKGIPLQKKWATRSGQKVISCKSWLSFWQKERVSSPEEVGTVSM